MMEFLTDLAAGAGSGIVGAFVGLLGGIGSAFVKYKTLRESNRHQFAMAELAGNQAVAEANAQLQRIRTEGEAAEAIEVQESLQASFQHDSSIGSWLQGRELGRWSTGVLVFVESIRMLMRPVITLGFACYVAVMYHDHFALVAQSGHIVPIDQLMAHTAAMANAIILMAVTAVGWWFADRSVQKALSKRLPT